MSESESDPGDDRAALEEERDLLLRSLDDLDTERDAGDLDDATHERLHAQYTARAASVLRRLDEIGPAPDAQDTTNGSTGGDADAGALGTKETPPASTRRISLAGRVGLIAALAVFAVLAVALLTNAVGDRGEGETATGNSQSSAGEIELTMPEEVARELETLSSAAAANPDDYDAQYDYAFFIQDVDPQTALLHFDAAAAIDESRPEPRASAAWIVVRVAAESTDEDIRQELLAGAIERLDEAIALDNGYLPAYAYKGLAVYAAGDPAGAIPLLEQYLESAEPDDPLRLPVTDVLAGAVSEIEAAGSSSDTGAQG